MYVCDDSQKADEDELKKQKKKKLKNKNLGFIIFFLYRHIVAGTSASHSFDHDYEIDEMFS